MTEFMYFELYNRKKKRLESEDVTENQS